MHTSTTTTIAAGAAAAATTTSASAAAAPPQTDGAVGRAAPSPLLLLLKGRRWYVEDPYHPQNDLTFFGRTIALQEAEENQGQTPGGEASSSSLSHAAKTGYRLWDSSIALAKYLEHSQQEYKWEGKRVLEVGAGCGLVGIALALQGANVVMTDLEEVLPNLQRNLQANKLLHKDALQAEPQVRIGCLRWGHPLDVDAICAITSQTQRDTKEKPQEAEEKGFDYVVASDVIWLDHLVEPLVQTLVMVAKKGCPQQPTEIILAQETRSLRVERKFFEQMEEEGFSLHPVAWDELHPDFRNRAITIYRIRPTASLLHNSK